MIPVRPQDIRHKIELLRLLTAITEDRNLSQNLYFKGGTCASMLNFLDRFSIDLDFDLKIAIDPQKIRASFLPIFSKLGLKIKDQSTKVPQFVLSYEATKGLQNTIKLDAFGPVFKTNTYKPQYLLEIDRIVNCQTIETMFANKLVAPLDRFGKHGSIAGRDIYDIHHFFLNGYKYEPEIIKERTGMEGKKYLLKLVDFISEKVTKKTIDEDLNSLLAPEKFQKIRAVLKTETLMFLRDNLAKYQ